VEVDGVQYKGHEFHYSGLSKGCTRQASYKVLSARSKEVDMPIYKTPNCWSSYFHVYLGQSDKMKEFLKQMELKL
jgi:cobyrinic acid a,c-diamide synthase